MADQPDADALALTVGGLAFAGWKSVRVRLSMEHCASGFDLGVSDLFANFVMDRQDIAPGEACELVIGRETVITGYVDEVELSIDAGTHQVQVSGRDKTADLVDCSAVGKAGQWRGLRIEQIAAELAKPFGVAVRTQVDTGKALTSFALQEGETVFEAIQRAAQIRGLLLVTDGLGALVITRAGVNRVTTPLTLGGNILTARARHDMRDRFSVYAAKGQVPGTEWSWGKAASQLKAVAFDSGVVRHRPMIITNDAPDVAASLADRVWWEANQRAAKSLEVHVTVQGWRHAHGLWRPNTLVNVLAPELKIEDELLIVGVEYSLDENGSTTRLALTRSDAFSLLPMKASTGVPKSGWSDPSIVGHAAPQVKK